MHYGILKIDNFATQTDRQKIHKAANRVLLILSFSFFYVGSLEENGEIICEHYEKTISCPAGKVIKVGYTNYGRTSDIPCQGARKYITTNCRSKTSLKIATKECQGKKSCTLKALNSIWGNPCQGVIKYLDVRYQCVTVASARNDTSQNILGKEGGMLIVLNCVHSQPDPV